jgi:AcrR family transcriptional regulator
MDELTRAPSARQSELLELAYRYALEHGLADLTLRPLAAAIGSSPRVLMFLFGSKDGLVRALLARARIDELALVDSARRAGPSDDLATAVRVTWKWLSAKEHVPLLTLWFEAYTRSLTEPDGPWAGFARQTVDDWLGVLATSQSPQRRRSPAGIAERSLALAVLRGGLLDLLATGDNKRVTAAVQRHIAHLRAQGPSPGP